MPQKYLPVSLSPLGQTGLRIAVQLAIQDSKSLNKSKPNIIKNHYLHLIKTFYESNPENVKEITINLYGLIYSPDVVSVGKFPGISSETTDEGTCIQYYTLNKEKIGTDVFFHLEMLMLVCQNFILKNNFTHASFYPVIKRDSMLIPFADHLSWFDKQGTDITNQIGQLISGKHQVEFNQQPLIMQIDHGFLFNNLIDADNDKQVKIDFRQPKKIIWSFTQACLPKWTK